MSDVVLMGDPLVAAVPVEECGEELVDVRGRQLDMGTPVDASPEDTDGACYLAATNISSRARSHREVPAAALHGAGLVNYPTEWWHWSYGDRYWALTTGHPHAIYGPAEA